MGAIAHRLTVRDIHHAAREYHFKPWRFIPGYFVAVAIHTLFNQFPSQPMLAMLGTALIAPMTLMAILRFGTNEATEWLTEEREAHRALLATLYAGSFPDTPGWRKIAALAEREDGQTAERIREYVLVLTRLIVSEEDVLLRQSHDTHRVETDGRKQFARLDELKQELGSTTVHALTSLLPFSRADYWEAWELHHHLDHSKAAKQQP
jgi:protease PrsW